jgi:hypothetical protein
MQKIHNFKTFTLLLYKRRVISEAAKLIETGDVIYYIRGQAVAHIKGKYGAMVNLEIKIFR